ncbi:MAG TPA: formate/nitrite transporter family protein [Steroidobacteraceae bacterium]|jgi:formate/nitrite transporter FocA (FNT family)|nr:formate/nitrite transporter family protein [Steroidobacteraceae bacterium]
MSTTAKGSKGKVPKGGQQGPLDADEQNQAAEHSAIRALVIHEVLRLEGEEELKRRPAALAWSGFAAGLSMGFSFLSLALIQSGLPSAPWTRLVDSFGYTIGFMVVILGRQALFTESTLTAVLPVLVRRDRRTLMLTLRFWVIVLSCNLVGTLLFAALISLPGVFPDAIVASLNSTASDAIGGSFWPTLVKAILAGWMIALMVWLLPSARTAKILVILIVTYVVGIGRFSHIVAGSVDSAFAVFNGGASVSKYFLGFLIPTLLGNILGGVGMVALLNHVPLAPDLEGSEPTIPIEK